MRPPCFFFIFIVIANNLIYQYHYLLYIYHIDIYYHLYSKDRYEYCLTVCVLTVRRQYSISAAVFQKSKSIPSTETETRNDRFLKQSFSVKMFVLLSFTHSVVSIYLSLALFVNNFAPMDRLSLFFCLFVCFFKEKHT